MISLTFGEQVKIVLSRKGMTIKELAELIQEKTGKKMSRQNLTQRLGRDNFQEQDMRMIADILGCSFQLSILASSEAAQKASVIEEVLPTEGELHKLEVKKEQKKAREEAERDITIGEFVDMMQNPVPAGETEPEEAPAKHEMPIEVYEKEVTAAVPVKEEPEAEPEPIEEEQEEASAGEPEAQEEPVEEAADEPSAQPVHEPEQVEEAEPEPAAAEETYYEDTEEDHRESKFSKITKIISGPRRQDKKPESGHNFEPIKKRNDEEENREIGDVNPYTGHEYQTNSVRMHPKRIGYVQVYDRKEHKWTDMTEWAFLGMEERKRAMLGKDYEPPVYLD